MQQGLNPWLLSERLAPKPLNHKDLLTLRASFFHVPELASLSFDWTFAQTSQAKEVRIYILMWRGWLCKCPLDAGETSPNFDLSLSSENSAWSLILGFGLWEVKMLWVWVMGSNILVLRYGIGYNEFLLFYFFPIAVIKKKKSFTAWYCKWLKYWFSLPKFIVYCSAVFC
jgi:hypothetical protein